MTSYTYKRSSTLCVSKTVCKLCMCISEKCCPFTFLPGPCPCSAKLLGPHQRQRSETQHISSLLNSPAADGWTAAVQLSSCAPAASVCVTVAVTLRVQCWTDINFCAEYNRGKCTSLRGSTVTWWNSVMATLTTSSRCWKASGMYMTIDKLLIENHVTTTTSFQAITW